MVGLGVHRAEHAHERHSRAAYSGRRVLLHRLVETLDATSLAAISFAAGRLDSVSRSSGALVSGDRMALSGISKGSFFQ